MSDNIIQYTSRTYTTILNDINSVASLADKPNWFKRLIAGLGDSIGMWNNASANQSYLRTAFTRQVVTDLCELLDYFLTPQQTSSGNILFYLNADSVVFPKTLLTANLKARSQGTLDVSSKLFEARSSVVVSAISETFTTDFASDNNLDVARVYTTGEKVRLSSTTTLPSPLQASTDYYVIYVSDTEITLATSIANAYKGTEITLTDDGTGTHTIALFSTEVLCYQQESIPSQAIGTSDGTTSWQRFDLPDLNIIEDTLDILINSVPWTKVDTLVDSLSTDTHYLLKYNTTDNSSYIQFGDGTYGAIPGNFDIFAEYSIGGGLNSNVSSLNYINIYAGSDTDVLGVSNPVVFNGGSNAESLENAKVLAPLLLKARNRFVTSTDGEALALTYGGISRAKVIANQYGLLSAAVPIVPNGGGTPSSTLKTNLQTYLIDRTVLESMDIRVLDPTYITVTPVVQVKVDSGYSFANVKPFVMLALRLLFSEVTYEIKQDYIENGITSAVAFINSKWSTSFAEEDYVQIINLIENVDPTDFGVSYQESDVLGFVDVFVFGVTYLTISSPAFPITVTSTEITTDNVLTGNVTEI